MSAFVLKLIACFSMFIDHLGYVIFDNFSYFNFIGRLAFPIFAFQIAEGYKHTKSLKKYFSRLIIFALIAQIPFSLYYYVTFESIAINTIFTLILGLLCIFIYDKYHKFVGLASTILIGLIAEILNFDYGFYGVILVFIFHIFNDKKALMALSFVFITFLKYFIKIAEYSFSASAIYLYSLLIFFISLSIIPILLYNGKKGRNTKYLFYIFYPSHLLFLYILQLVI